MAPLRLFIKYAINNQLKESACVGMDQKHNDSIGSGTGWKGIVIFLQGLMVDDVYQSMQLPNISITFTFVVVWATVW